MLYLEDYLEMIEVLPEDLRDRFTDMREMDLFVHNEVDKLSNELKTFFQNKCKVYSQEKREEEFRKIISKYNRALEEADEKITIATQMLELVEKYMRKLDFEISHFKLELEADCAGVTEVLEQRSLEMDQKPKGSGANNGAERKRQLPSSSTSNQSDYKKVCSSRNPTSSNHLAAGNQKSGGSRSNTPLSSSHSYSYNLGQIGASSDAIATAASQAIAKTQQMKEGRRTASLKASYEAFNLVKGHADLGNLLSNRDASSAINTNPQVVLNADLKMEPGTVASTSATTSSGGSSRKSKKSSTKSSKASGQQSNQASSQAYENAADDDDWGTNDPSEDLRWCHCNQVSYGDMVACDNRDCPLEWFHYGCVGLTTAPKGKWYCPDCTQAMKRRGQKDKYKEKH